MFVNDQSRHLVISYSDGEGSEHGGVAAALWYVPDVPPVVGYMKVPPCIRSLWEAQRRRRYNDM